MAIEGATERSVFVDANDFATALSYTPTGGSASTVNGIHDTAIGPNSDGTWPPIGVFRTPS